MKKILSLALACALVAALGSCNKKAAATPGVTAKRYVEHVVNDDYEAFVKGISFTKPVDKAYRVEADKAHAAALRAIHHPRTVERGGIKEVKVVSEKLSTDKKTCDVVLANHYNNGTVSTVNMSMIKDGSEWKVRETPSREIWKATTSEGDTEVVKVRTGGERDVVKDRLNDMGEKQFVKDINRAGGEVEVVKVLEDGTRHKEVINSAVETATEASKTVGNAAGKVAGKAAEAGKAVEQAADKATEAGKSVEQAAGKAAEAGKAVEQAAGKAVEAAKSLPRK
jgi:hypothetical protein